MAEIELRNVRKNWGEFVGVDDVSMKIADQEFVVFLGPSGCGKTTTMRMIAGLEDPTGGEVIIDGEVVNDVDARDRDVAMVFQSYALYPNMTIFENIRFPLRMRGIPKSQHVELVKRAAEMVELGDYLDRKPGALSGGQRQRAALARAVVRQPHVFLMDEPLSNLDAKLRSAMRVQIKHLQRRLKITTVYVTHDQVEAMTLADRIVIMNGGAIQQIGTPDEIYTNPANTFIAGFIGSPPMNLIKGHVEGGTFTAPGVRVEGIAVESGRAVTLGIRPEDCHLNGTPSQMTGTVFGIEPTGDQTLVSLRTDDDLFEIRADRDFRAPLDTTAHIGFDLDRLYLFDGATGERLR
ncbi:ABC transporter ATP-binding protein [Pelagibius litoralis]|uniref:ABC transporter ATP-binding protein n=1 Tax=Pelagibius litoralis TaxID=374515 RepID=A0A967EVY4_9PROT|nr:ABC transporter ATP-binding protein [Pelagibius litoralis]NIA68704.1 ABC transporter ATP-binding protein [Pelagibius litoralis]